MAIPKSAYPPPFNVTRASHVVITSRDLGASRARCEPHRRHGEQHHGERREEGTVRAARAPLSNGGSRGGLRQAGRVPAGTRADAVTVRSL